MPLALEEVEYIANLARLELSEAEINLYRQQLSAILDYFARLNELDTAEAQPMTGVLASHDALREDQPRPGLPRGLLLENAPQAEDGQVRVPPVLE